MSILKIVYTYFERDMTWLLLRLIRLGGAPTPPNLTKPDPFRKKVFFVGDSSGSLDSFGPESLIYWKCVIVKMIWILYFWCPDW